MIGQDALTGLVLAEFFIFYESYFCVIAHKITYLTNFHLSNDSIEIIGV